MAEKTIMLCCAAGMSTSLLVSKMQKAAEAQNLDVEIFATGASDADNQLEAKKIDCVLLGPQVRFMEGQFKEKLAPKGIGVEVIDMKAYGMMDGETVLKQALTLIG